MSSSDIAGDVHSLTSIVYAAFPLPTAAASVFQDAPNGGFGEAVMAF